MKGGDHMPNMNGTGPNGQGPMTGRRRGGCYDGRRGFGCGYGNGLGFGGRMRAIVSACCPCCGREDSVEDLQAEKIALEKELELVNEEIENNKKQTDQ